MGPIKKLPFGYFSDLNASHSDHVSSIDTMRTLQLIESGDSIGTDVSPIPRSPSRDWSILIERVRRAAQHVREVEAQAQEQELRVQEVLDRVQQDVRNAAERVRAAEARTAAIQSRADALLKAADEKVMAAEERARIAEEWLARVHETIVTEFVGTSEPDRLPNTKPTISN